MIGLVKEILARRILLNDEDDFRIEKNREELIEVLSRDVDSTIEILNQLNEIEILYTSEVFEEVAYNLNNWDYIECLKQIQKKFCKLDIADSIKVAEEYM